MRQQLRRLRETARLLPWLLMARLPRATQKDLPDSLDDKRVLIIQWNALGDALMTTPLLSSLKRRFPRARIDLLATRVNRAVFDGRTDVGFVYAFRARQVILNWKLWSSLKRSRYDAIIDASALVRSACMTRSLGAGSIGLSRRIETGFFRIDLARYYRLAHPYSERRNIAEMIGSLASSWETPVLGKLTFHVPAAAAKTAKDWCAAKGVEADRTVILHPGAKWAPKRWPESHWIELSRLLLDRWNPVIVGSENDGAMIQRISRSAGPGVNELVGCDIATLSGIVQEARAAICNDSFIMHLASALGKPVVALFGPVEPRRVAPAGTPIEVLYREVFCSPCELYFSADRCWRGLNFCLQHIEPTQVLVAFEDLVRTP
jgi:lipopolysaccharide heptosyltransferase II